MIHLDTNFLIGAITTGSYLRGAMDKWFAAGEQFATSAISWSEFVTGPVTPSQIQTALTILENRIVPFGFEEAMLAADLYNQIGRKRSLRIDSFVAAVAISSSASLATENRRDFSPFVPGGLRLA
jgi:predicted nucleic acid-binding protein